MFDTDVAHNTVIFISLLAPVRMIHHCDSVSYSRQQPEVSADREDVSGDETDTSERDILQSDTEDNDAVPAHRLLAATFHSHPAAHGETFHVDYFSFSELFYREFGNGDGLCDVLLSCVLFRRRWKDIS